MKVTVYVTFNDGAWHWWAWPDRFAKIESHRFYGRKQTAIRAASRWFAKWLPKTKLEWDID